MSEKCDTLKQVRLTPNNYRQLAYIKRKSAAKPTIGMLVNMAIDLGMKSLIERMLPTENKHQTKTYAKE